MVYYDDAKNTIVVSNRQACNSNQVQAISWLNQLQKCKDSCFLSPALPCPFSVSYNHSNLADTIRYSFHPDYPGRPLIWTFFNGYRMKITAKLCFVLIEPQLEESPLSVSMLCIPVVLITY